MIFLKKIFRFIFVSVDLYLKPKFPRLWLRSQRDCGNGAFNYMIDRSDVSTPAAMGRLRPSLMCSLCAFFSPSALCRIPSCVHDQKWVCLISRAWEHVLLQFLYGNGTAKPSIYKGVRKLCHRCIISLKLCVCMCAHTHTHIITFQLLFLYPIVPLPLK